MGFIADDIIAKAEAPRKAEDLPLTKTASGFAAQHASLLTMPAADPLVPIVWQEIPQTILGHETSSGSGSFIRVISPVSNGWQMLTCDPQHAEQTDQLRLDGGWLVRTSKGTSLAVIFVPDQTK
jgi:hypothetical protein